MAAGGGYTLPISFIQRIRSGACACVGTGVSTCVLGAALKACVPWPHHDYVAPALRGVLTRDGQPVAQARLMVSTPAYRQQPAQFAVTGPDGQFAVAPIRRLRLFARAPLGDPGESYELRLLGEGDDKGPGRPIYYIVDRLGETPASLRLRCELTLPPGSDVAEQPCVVTTPSPE